MNTEEWKPIPGFPHYEASSEGRIRSLDRPHHPGRVMRQQYVNWGSSVGYKQVGLRENYKVHTMKVHRLVTMAFLANPTDLPQVRHLDGNPENNNVDNLAWGTQVDNMQDMLGHGRHRSARKTHCPAGHPYAGENLRIVSTRGTRTCRTCVNGRKRANPSATNQKRTTGPTGYKGVGFEKRTGRYTAQISVGNKMRRLGRFDNPEDAARAYDAAARERWGADARLNFPEVAA